MMIAIAHLIAIGCYLGAAALAAMPFARPVDAPLRGVIASLGLGVAAHASALLAFSRLSGAPPLTGLGPSLSFAGLVLAVTLLLVEVLAREVSLTVIAAPLAALPTTFANVIGLVPGRDPAGMRGVWLFAHITLSFVGIAAFATAAAAGTMYLIQRRELKSRRFGAIFRFFPPLATLDQVNRVSAIAGWLGLTLGIVLAGSYSIAYRELNVPQLVWGTGAWITVSGVVFGRVVARWPARRSALLSTVGFGAVILVYVAFRVVGPAGAAGKFM